MDVLFLEGRWDLEVGNMACPIAVSSGTCQICSAVRGVLKVSTEAQSGRPASPYRDPRADELRARYHELYAADESLSSEIDPKGDPDWIVPPDQIAWARQDRERVG